MNSQCISGKYSSASSGNLRTFFENINNCESKIQKLKPFIKEEFINNVNFRSAMSLILAMSEDTTLQQRNKRINFICECSEISTNECECSTEIEQEDTTIDKIILSTNNKTRKIAELRFDSKLFMFFPQGMENEMFNEMKCLSVIRCGLVKITKKNFETLKYLEKLDLSENILIKIPADVFNGLTNLQEIVLSNNQIRTISVGSFEKLDKLNILELDGNFIKTISAGLFEIINDGIEYLSLEGNDCIDMAYPTDEKSIISNHILDFCVEPVTFTCELTEESTCQAKNLNITYPKTKVFVEENIENQVNLGGIKILILIDQQMKFMPFNLSTNFPNLEQMSVNNSELTQLLSTDFKGFITLKTLEITNNNIT